MKWCFLLNNADFLMEFLGKLAFQVIKEGDECIIVANSKVAEYGKRKYFPQETEVFSKVDWCIKNYQKEKKDFLNFTWKEFFSTFDRKYKFFNFDYANSVEIVSQLHQFIDCILERERPDIVINEAPANIFTEVAYYLCKKRNIAYLGLMGSKFEKQVDVYDLKYTYSSYKKTFEERGTAFSKDEEDFAKNFIEGFLSHKQLPSYVKNHVKEISHLKNYLKREKEIVSFWFKYFPCRKQFKKFDYESEAVFIYNFWHLWNAFKNRIRKILFRSYFHYLSSEEKFFLFPLHLQPEASTSAQATYFCDQLNTIKNIAFSLPFPYKLYVKEHPVAVGTRTKDFYKKLKQIPNVVLIAPDESAEKLIKKSQGVITLTSTIGMEAALAGKQVYVLGNVFYSYHPLCRNVNGFEDLRQKIQLDLNKKPFFSNLENINSRFIVSYFKNTIKGNIVSASRKNDSNDYKKIYQEIKEKFLEDEKS